MRIARLAWRRADPADLLRLATVENNCDVPIERHRPGRSCDAAKARLHQQALAAQTQNDAANPRRGGIPALHCVLCKAQCVAEGDPRLKAN
jgi:hypothetical protein